MRQGWTLEKYQAWLNEHWELLAKNRAVENIYLRAETENNEMKQTKHNLELLDRVVETHHTEVHKLEHGDWGDRKMDCAPCALAWLARLVRERIQLETVFHDLLRKT